MWLMTTQGFYSVVAHRDLPGVMLVRARAKADLIALDRQIPGLEARITCDERADYLWRAAASREEWALALARLANEVDYDNFKSAVAARQGHKRAGVYHAVWSALTRIEKGFAKRYYHTVPASGPSHIDTSHHLCAWVCSECGEGGMDSEHRCVFCNAPRPDADPLPPSLLDLPPASNGSRSMSRSARKRQHKAAK
jgi:hypothetical protein